LFYLHLDKNKGRQERQTCHIMYIGAVAFMVRGDSLIILIIVIHVESFVENVGITGYQEFFFVSILILFVLGSTHTLYIVSVLFESLFRSFFVISEHRLTNKVSMLHPAIQA
ncbi:hypothetical protein ACJX0J_022435, partial [Zea mays]